MIFPETLADIITYRLKITLLAEKTCFGRMADRRKSVPIKYRPNFGRNISADNRPGPKFGRTLLHSVSRIGIFVVNREYLRTREGSAKRLVRGCEKFLPALA